MRTPNTESEWSGDADLTIKLVGTNSITLDNGGGIFADGSSVNYNIIGDGKLTIDVKWDALYTLNGNISISEGAELDITSAKGCGITSYNKGRISIDDAKVATLLRITLPQTPKGWRLKITAKLF